MASNIDFDLVQERVLRGLYAGVGGVLSGAVGNFVSGQFPNTNMAVAAANIGVGAGASIGADMVFQDVDSVPNDLIEYAGYGMQAQGWDEVASSFNIGFDNAGDQQVVDVREVDTQTVDAGSVSAGATQTATAGAF